MVRAVFAGGVMGVSCAPEMKDKGASPDGHHRLEFYRF